MTPSQRLALKLRYLTLSQGSTSALPITNYIPNTNENEEEKEILESEQRAEFPAEHEDVGICVKK